MDRRCCKTSNIEEESQNSPPSNQGANLRRLRSEHGLQTLRLEKMQLGEEHDQQSDQTHEGASSIKYKRKVPDFCTRQYKSQQPEVQEHNQLQPQPRIERDISRLREEEAIKQARQTFVMEVCKSVGKSMGGPSWGGTLGAGLGAYFNGISVRDTIPVDSTNVSTSIKHIHLIMWLYHILRPSVESRRRIIKTLSNQRVKNISREYVENAVIAALGTRGKGRLGEVISILSKSTIAAGRAYATTCYSDEIGNTIEAYWKIVQNWQKKG